MLTTTKVKKASKRSVIVDIMTKNKDKSMADVVQLIVDSTAFTHHARPVEEARYYYGKFVRMGVAPGNVVRQSKVVKAKSVKKTVTAVQSTVAKSTATSVTAPPPPDLSFLAAAPPIDGDTAA